MYDKCIFYTLGIGEAEVWTEDSEGYSDFQIVTEVWVEPQCGYVQMPTQSTAIYMHPLQYHQLPDAVSTVFILQLLKILFLFMYIGMFSCIHICKIYTEKCNNCLVIILLINVFLNINIREKCVKLFLLSIYLKLDIYFYKLNYRILYFFCV